MDNTVFFKYIKVEKILIQRGISLIGFSVIKRIYKGKSGLITIVIWIAEIIIVKYYIIYPSDLSKGAPIYI